ncbi:MAG: DUF72 domain-containing protein [Proteobacteria bacterium]|nr:DUF72 domain-containing protein [Pseudomonadota bacterium]
MDRGLAGIHVGTSGWHYPHWRGPFYPEGTPAAAFLATYARRFSTVEINNTFYRLPSAAAFGHWYEATPAGFVFACKASRFITHMKKLKDPEVTTARFFTALKPLKEKLGPILFQLPPRWRLDPGRLDAFLAALPRGLRYAFECRDESWFDERVYDLLAARGAAFAAFDLAGLHSPLVATAGFAYVRLHGPGGAYQGSYDSRALRRWARQALAWREEGREVFVYFDNDEAGFAALDAARLDDILAGEAGLSGPAAPGSPGARAGPRSPAPPAPARPPRAPGRRRVRRAPP